MKLLLFSFMLGRIWILEVIVVDVSKHDYIQLRNPNGDIDVYSTDIVTMFISNIFCIEPPKTLKLYECRKRNNCV